MTARDDYPLLATAERLEEFGEAHRALDEIDRLRAENDYMRGRYAFGVGFNMGWRKALEQRS